MAKEGKLFNLRNVIQKENHHKIGALYLPKMKDALSSWTQNRSWLWMEEKLTESFLKICLSQKVLYNYSFIDANNETHRLWSKIPWSLNPGSASSVTLVMLLILSGPQFSSSVNRWQWWKQSYWLITHTDNHG